MLPCFDILSFALILSCYKPSSLVGPLWEPTLSKSPHWLPNRLRPTLNKLETRWLWATKKIKPVELFGNAGLVSQSPDYSLLTVRYLRRVIDDDLRSVDAGWPSDSRGMEEQWGFDKRREREWLTGMNGLNTWINRCLLLLVIYLFFLQFFYTAFKNQAIPVMLYINKKETPM